MAKSKSETLADRAQNALDAVLDEPPRPAPEPLRVADLRKLLSKGERIHPGNAPHFTGRYFDLTTGFEALSKKFTPPAAPLPKLRELQDAWVRANETILQYAVGHKDFVAQRRHLESLDPEGLAGAQVKSREQLDTEREAKRAAAKVARRNISGAAKRYAMEILKAFQSLALDEAEALEKQELKNAAAISVAFRPSDTLQFIVQLAWQITDYAPLNASPAEMIQPTGVKL